MNDNELLYLLWLNNIEGIGPVAKRKLLNEYGSAENIFLSDEEQICDVKNLDSAKKLLDEYDKREIGLIDCFDERLPEIFRENVNLPMLLYYYGTIQDMSNTAAVVGPRRCDRWTRQKAINVATRLAKDGKSIVSGMAIGVDGYSHTAAIKNDAYTIAVIGCGVDICYPKSHIELYERIKKDGLILSEYAPGTIPDYYNFPRRNRIIAALASEVHVINPGKKSGSLITAQYAKDYGKAVIIYNRCKSDEAENRATLLDIQEEYPSLLKEDNLENVLKAAKAKI